MISATSMAVLLYLIVFLISLFASPATADPLYSICSTSTGNIISNSTYSFNLKHLLSNLSSNTSATGFATYTTGSIPDRVHGLALCRGDINSDSCRSCISLAVPGIQHLCPNNNSAIIWYDYCQLRYSKQDFLYAPNVSSNIMLYMFNNQDVSAKLLPRFESLTPALIGNLSDLAVRNTSRLFATGETVLTVGYTIYGLVQCARDLSDRQCRKCLQGTEDATTRDPLKGKMGGRVLGMWCNMRYEFYKFYNGTSMLQLSSDLSPSPSPLPQPSPPSQPSLPSPSSPPTPTQNATHSPVNSAIGGSSTVDIVLAVIIPVIVALARIA